MGTNFSMVFLILIALMEAYGARWAFARVAWLVLAVLAGVVLAM
jgi:hypothetical protein